MGICIGHFLLKRKTILRSYFRFSNIEALASGEMDSKIVIWLELSTHVNWRSSITNIWIADLGYSIFTHERLLCTWVDIYKSTESGNHSNGMISSALQPPHPYSWERIDEMHTSCNIISLDTALFRVTETHPDSDRNRIFIIMDAQPWVLQKSLLLQWECGKSSELMTSFGKRSEDDAWNGVGRLLLWFYISNSIWNVHDFGLIFPEQNAELPVKNQTKYKLYNNDRGIKKRFLSKDMDKAYIGDKQVLMEYQFQGF